MKGRRQRRRVIALAAIACSLALSSVVPTIRPGVAASAHGEFAGGSAGRVATVDVRAIAGTRSQPGGGHRAPFLSPRISSQLPAHAGHVPVADAGVGAVATTTTTTASLSVLTGFPVMSLDGQISAFGGGQNVTPPDTQLAAGPVSLLETINDSGSVWSTSGGQVTSFDLAVFFHVAAGSFFSDPRVLYDAPTGRWFISGLSFTPPSYGSTVYLAVSTGSDPTGTWSVYSAAASTNVLHDQPKIGVSADKLVMSWNEFQNASTFLGETTYVWQKSQLLSASSSVALSGVVADGSRSSLVPAQRLAYTPSDTNAYVVYNNSHCLFCSGASIGVLTVTGTPLQGNVGWTETDPGIFATSTPPSADQPGAPGSIATNDDRFLTAVIQAGTLWTSGNDACVPNGDSSSRPCARFIAVAVAGSAIAQDFDLGTAGAGLYYPAVGLDQGGDMLATYSVSSTSLFPGVRVIGESGGALLPGQTVKNGETKYDDTPCLLANPPSRWGDYSSAAVDPSAPGHVWVAGEYAATSSLSATNGCAWGTYAALLTVATSSPPPAPAASVSPTSIAFGNQPVGTSSSSQTVTVTNTGTADLVISAGGVTVTDAVDFRLVTNSCASSSTSTTIAPNATCTFTISFAPASVGTFSATARISDNAASSPQTVALTGSGVKRRH